MLVYSKSIGQSSYEVEIVIRRFTVSRDDSIYEAWPDVTVAGSGRLVCVFAECTHHADRGYTRMMYATSDDRGRTWSAKRPLTDPLHGEHRETPFWDNPRISTLSDGRLCVVVDKHYPKSDYGVKVEVFMLFSSDEGQSWSAPALTSVRGGGLDQVIELVNRPHAGRWVLACHQERSDGWKVDAYTTDDGGATWQGPHPVAARGDLKLCEPSVVELPGGQLACFMREESKRGLDAFKCVSRDGGQTWTDPVEFPLPNCHRPIAGMLNSDRVLITHRFAQCGKGWLGWWAQNTFAALTDVESCLAESRNEARTRIMPLDYDRSPVADGGYTGWVQYEDGEIYVVNYIVDDAPNAHIRGYSLREDDFVLGG